MSKPLIISLICTLFCSFITPDKNSEERISLEVTQKGWHQYHGEFYLTINASIRNVSKDTISFINMLCSYDEAFIVEDSNLSIRLIECDRNFPVLNLIPPNETLDYELDISKKDSSPYNFKLGFLWFYPSKKTDRRTNMLFMDSTCRPDKIIWSKQTTLY